MGIPAANPYRSVFYVAKATSPLFRPNTAIVHFISHACAFQHNIPVIRATGKQNKPIQENKRRVDRCVPIRNNDVTKQLLDGVTDSQVFETIEQSEDEYP